MRKISAILVAFLILATVQTAIATEGTINLCQKEINVGGSWGVCDPNQVTIAQGTFDYNTVGAEMSFIAEATSPVDITGQEYSLIYYKDTDAAHIIASTKAVNVLATSIGSLYTVSFSGIWNDGDIPAIDDVNLRGKIWMVKSSEINSDGTLKWTGYADGATMVDYLFESDLIAETLGDGLTVLNRMGGITYTYVPNNYIPATTEVLACPLVGVSIGAESLVFGMLYPGTASAQVTRELTISGGVDGSSCLEVVDVSVEGTNWIGIGNSMENSQTEVSIDLGDFTALNTEFLEMTSGTYNMNFIVNVPDGQAPDTYTQTITVSGIY